MLGLLTEWRDYGRELEEKLISGLRKRVVEAEKKRVVRSRVVGSLSGYWI
jgi:hypothetical protein